MLSRVLYIYLQLVKLDSLNICNTLYVNHVLVKFDRSPQSKIYHFQGYKNCFKHKMNMNLSVRGGPKCSGKKWVEKLFDISEIE